MKSAGCRLAAVLLGWTLAAQAGSDAGMELRDLPPDRLLFQATRYGDTPRRRALKAEARDEVRRRMPGIFTEVMDRLAYDNIGLQVLAMELAQSDGTETLTGLLAGYLDHPDDDTRRVATYFLSFQKREDGLVPRLLAGLEDPVVQGGALRTLAAWQVHEAAAPAMNLLASDRERIRVAAANALRDLADAAAAPRLIDALEDPVVTVRQAAGRALVALGDEALPAITSALNGPVDLSVRRRLARCLYDVGTPAARDRLDTLAPDLPVEDRAILGLEETGGETHLRHRVEAGFVRRP